jgi:hypothetical protein
VRCGPGSVKSRDKTPPDAAGFLVQRRFYSIAKIY